MVPTDETALPPSGPDPVASGRIVIVDDDPRVCTALCQTLAGDRLKTGPEACWQVDTFSGHLTGAQTP